MRESEDVANCTVIMILSDEIVRPWRLPRKRFNVELQDGGDLIKQAFV